LLLAIARRRRALPSFMSPAMSHASPLHAPHVRVGAGRPVRAWPSQRYSVFNRTPTAPGPSFALAAQASVKRLGVHPKRRKLQSSCSPTPSRTSKPISL
jgi:hypothetical protein